MLAIGSNGAPATLERKFAHFESEGDRTVLALSGRLHEFDVGVAAQPTMYGSLPATLFPSPGTAAGATVLWVTPAQFTQLTWSEFTYRLGRLRTRFEVEETGTELRRGAGLRLPLRRLLPGRASRSPWPRSRPLGRGAPELSEEQLLDRAAGLALGAGTDAATLVRAIFERPAATAERVAATLHRAALRFSSPRWTPFGSDA